MGPGRDCKDMAANLSFIQQRLTLLGVDREGSSSSSSVLPSWLLWIADEYLPQGRVLRFLAGNMTFFILGCVLLQQLPSTYQHDPERPYDPAFEGYTSHWVFNGAELAFLLASVCFFMVCIADFSVILVTENPLKRQLIWMIFFINVQATYTYGTMCWEHTPVFADGHHRPLYPIRWLMWGCSTASLIFMIAELAADNISSWPTVVLSDVIGLGLGFFSLYLYSPVLCWLCFVLGVVAYVPTVWGIYRLFSTGWLKLISRESTLCFKILAFSTIALWSAFPVIQLLAMFQLISPSLEAILYTILDVSVKVIYSLGLLRSNYYSIDQLEQVKRLGSEEILCKALATTREIELAGRILLTAKSETGAVKQLHRSFLSHMSHELRTPLNAMIGFNELLIEDTGLSSLQKAYITAALNSAKGLLGMIDNILEYSRLEGNVIHLDSREFDLNYVLDDVVDSLRKQAHVHGVDVVYSADMKGTNGKLIGDPHRLGQMLRHLVDNAIKSYVGVGREGQRVPTVEIRAHFASKRLLGRQGDGGWAELAQWPNGETTPPAQTSNSARVGTLTIEIEDHGRGIPEKELAKLFTPFGQVDGRGKSDGIGLGLAIVKQLVEAMGGHINCTSAEGVGSTFFLRNLTFPIGTRPAQPLPAATLEQLEKLSVSVVAFQPLLHGLAYHMQSLRIAHATIDAARDDALHEWITSVQRDSRRCKDDDTTQEDDKNNVLIIEAALLDKLRRVVGKNHSLPYGRFIVLAPPQPQTEGTVLAIDGPPREALAVDVEHLTRPITSYALRDVLLASAADKSDQQLILSTSTSKANLRHHQQGGEEARHWSAKEEEEEPFEYRVLVVDDNKVNQKVVGAILRRLDVPFDTANDGIEAIECICRTKYDLVLMDLTMPRMGGMEATRIVRTMEGRLTGGEAPLDIVAMTAATSKEAEDECMRSGFTLYMPKPVKFTTVKELVEEKVAAKKARLREQRQHS